MWSKTGKKIIEEIKQRLNMYPLKLTQMSILVNVKNKYIIIKFKM